MASPAPVPNFPPASMTVPAPSPTLPASAPAKAVDLSLRYQAAMGFSWRKESFGGILYWYEGVAPDPQVSFVDSPFLVEVLDLLGQAPLGEVLSQLQAHFSLPDAQMARVTSFVGSLIERGALVSES